MATDPQNAAGQLPVEALAVKLRRRYAMRPAARILSTVTKGQRSITRQVVGSRETALETALVLRQVVSKARFQNITQLVEIIRSVGRKLIEAQPKGAALPHHPSSSLKPLSSTRACVRTLKIQNTCCAEKQNIPSGTPCADCSTT